MIWTSLSDERKRYLVGLQMGLEESLLDTERKRYVEDLGRDPDMKAPEQHLLADVREQLAPVYQAWLDKLPEMRKTPSWMHGLALLGAATMADLTVRVVLSMMFNKTHTLDRYDPGEFLRLPTMQMAARAIGSLARDIAEYRIARKEFAEEWRKQSHFYKNWSVKRCLGFTAKFKTFIEMDLSEREDFGHHMLRIARDSTVIELITKKYKQHNRFLQRTYVSLSQEVLQDLGEQHQDILDALLPAYRPMICLPTEHSLTEAGGAVSRWMRRKSVKVLAVPEASADSALVEQIPSDNPEAREAMARAESLSDIPIQAPPMAQTLSDIEVRVLNALQRTEWAIDPQVLEVAEALFKSSTCEAGMPPYNFEEFTWVGEYPKTGTKVEQAKWLAAKEEAYGLWFQTQQKRRQVMLRLAEAKRLKQYPCFWHAWFCDFRGRKYTACELLSPQSGDLDRGLIYAATPMKQTKEGLYWLKVHVANLWDMDRGRSFDERVKWVDDNMAMFRAISQYPLDNKKHWCSNKKNKNPSFQRLSACFDLIRSIDTGLTRVAPMLDGSCNGAQHWAAIMRDPWLAHVVNLDYRDKPGDLYGTIAEKASTIAKADPNDYRDAMLAHWNGSIPRDPAKRPTMCDPYGITFYGIIKYCRNEGNLDWVPHEQLNNFSLELARLLDAALKDALVEPNKGKAWLRAISDVASAMNKSMEWVTYTGFHVKHRYHERFDRVSWASMFQAKLTFEHYDPSQVSGSDANQSISPNFTHSVDAAHMALVILRMLDAGIEHLVFVHDAYGTLGPDIPMLRSFIPEEFYRLHKDNPLQSLKDHMEKVLGIQLPPVPAVGTFDIGEVLNAPYIFG